MDRKDKIITESQDRAQEEATIKNALKRCGYPEWAFKQTKTKEKAVANKSKSETKARGMVVLHYKEGLSQRVRRIFSKHGINTAFKPHQTLRNILVHPKDKRDITQTTEYVYEIQCLN